MSQQNEQSIIIPTSRPLLSKLTIPHTIFSESVSIKLERLKELEELEKHLFADLYLHFEDNGIGRRHVRIGLQMDAPIIYDSTNPSPLRVTISYIGDLSPIQLETIMADVFMGQIHALIDAYNN
jgi:hypothetical protein